MKLSSIFKALIPRTEAERRGDLVHHLRLAQEGRVALEGERRERHGEVVEHARLAALVRAGLMKQRCERVTSRLLIPLH